MVVERWRTMTLLHVFFKNPAYEMGASALKGLFPYRHGDWWDDETNNLAFSQASRRVTIHLHTVLSGTQIQYLELGRMAGFIETYVQDL